MDTAKRLITLVFCALALGMVLKPAKAATFSGDGTVCANLAMNAMEVVQIRDAGIPVEVFESFLVGSLNAAVGDPASYVANADDATFIFKLLKQVFDDPTMDVAKAAEFAEQSCMKVATKTKAGLST